MSTPSSLPPAGWYPDPQGGGGQRWWNGAAWSTQTRPGPTPPAAPTGPQAPAPPYAAQQPYAGPSDHMGYPGAPQAYGTQQPYGAQSGYGGYAVAPPIGAWRSPADDRPAVTGMGTAIRTVFQKYARFDGRASRPEFWWWALFNGIIVVAVYIFALLLIIPASVSSYDAGNPLMPAGGVLGSLLFVALMLWAFAIVVPNLAVTVRRLRDAGFHWALIFLTLIPGGSIAVLVMSCLPSKYP